MCYVIVCMNLLCVFNTVHLNMSMRYIQVTEAASFRQSFHLYGHQKPAQHSAANIHIHNTGLQLMLQHICYRGHNHGLIVCYTAACYSPVLGSTQCLIRCGGKLGNMKNSGNTHIP